MDAIFERLEFTGHLSPFTLEHTVPRGRPSEFCTRQHCFKIESVDGWWEIQLAFAVASPVLQLPIDLFSYPLSSLTPALKANTMDLFSKQEMHLGFSRGVESQPSVTIPPARSMFLEIYIRGHRNCCQIPSHPMAECARYPLSKSSVSYALSLPNRDDACFGLRDAAQGDSDRLQLLFLSWSHCYTHYSSP